jgi:uncharacterized phiE125 gp8 family phage protein
MALVNLTRPTDTPVSLDEAKEQCRIVSSDTNHDSKLLRFIDDATQYIETLTGARLASQSVQLTLDGFPEADIDLGVYPVNSITSVKYDDGDNVETTMVLGTDYWQALSGMYPKLCPVTSWPATKYGKPETVRIVMDVGYYSGSPVTAAAPNDLRHAVLIKVKSYFDISGEEVIGQSVEPVGNSVKSHTDMYRRITV